MSVYKITDTYETSLMVYVGSTETTKEMRFSSHKSCYKRYKNGKYGKTYSFEIFDEFGVENCDIFILETLNEPYTAQELLICEQKWIDATDCVNKADAFVSEEQKKLNEQEYYKQNVERITQVSKKYRSNPEVQLQIKERQKEYLQTEHGKEVRRQITKRYADKFKTEPTEEELHELELIEQHRPDNFKTLTEKEKSDTRRKRARTREKFIRLTCMLYNKNVKTSMMDVKGGDDRYRKVISDTQRKTFTGYEDHHDEPKVKPVSNEVARTSANTGIRFSSYDKSWIYQWTENGKRRNKKIRVCDNSEDNKKHNHHKLTRTNEEAKTLIEEFRKQKLEEL